MTKSQRAADGRATMLLAKLAIAATAALGLLLLAAPVRAHVTWFEPPEEHPIAWGTGLLWPTALALGVAAALLGLAWLADQMLRRWRLPWLAPETLGISRVRVDRLYAWLPLLLATHLTFSLLALTVQLQLLAPHLQLPWHLVSGLLALAQLVVALALVYGAFTRAAAVGLALLVLALVPVFGLVRALEQLHYVGIAAFFFCLGRGPFSLDALLERPVSAGPRLRAYAVPLLRIFTGLGLVWVGFTEKLWNLPLAEAFLATYEFNFFPAIGMAWVSDRDFAMLAGIIEVTAGVLLASGLLTRLVVVVLWFPLNLTLPFLGPVELIGHLPLYAIMAILLVFGGGRRKPASLQPAEERRPRPSVTRRA